MLTKTIVAIAAATVSATCLAAQLRAVDGRVEIERNGVKFPGVRGVQLKQGDIIRTADKGEAVVGFVDGSAVAMRTNTQFSLDKYQTRGRPEERSKVIGLAVGTLRYVSAVFGSGQKMDTSLQTATATIGIRGTDFEMTYLGNNRASGDSPGTYVRVISGLVAVTGKDGSEVEVGAAQSAFAGEPQLAPMGGGSPPPASRRLSSTVSEDVFRKGKLDSILGGTR